MIGRMRIALLGVANRSRNLGDGFYELKRRLVRRYGRFVRNINQEILRECWGCEDGPVQGCSRCGGTGVYSIRWWRLATWEAYGHVFHWPASELFSRPSRGPSRALDLKLGQFG